MTIKKKTKRTTKVKDKVIKKPVIQNGEPRVELKSAGFDAKKGMRIELDWNDEFVEHLKQNGFTGVNDEAIVQKWIGYLYAELLKDVNPRTNEFE